MKTIYVDTSVFGGVFDPEFELWSDLFFKHCINFDLTLIISNIVEEELSKAPERVKEFVNSIPENNIQRVELTEEAVLLAERYLAEGVVGRSSRADCYHIALATILKADILVSWNFKHIVNIQRINCYNAVNLMNGYKTIEIRNPREIFDYENDD